MLWDIVLGGITGLLGNAITSYTNFKTQKLKNLHDIDKWKHEDKKIELETKAMIAEAGMKMEIIKTEVEGAVELADTNAFMANIKQSGKKSFSEKWLDKLFAVTGWLKYISIPVAILIAFLFGIVDFLKALMRPGLTAYLVGLSTWITYIAWEILQRSNLEAMTAVQASAIFQEVTSVIIYLTVSCVTFWFGDRRIAKFLMRLKEK